MDEQVRYKGADAFADSYYVICPFKSCGHSNTLNTAAKDDIVRCTNCSKKFKIKKVVLK